MPVILTLDPACTLADVLPKLEAAGFKVGGVMEELHVVSGEGDARAMKKVRKLADVVAAEVDRTVRLDPREVPDLGAKPPGRRDRQAAPPVTGASWRSASWGDDPA
jgi:hypothetical protein